jgi:DedD protein
MSDEGVHEIQLNGKQLVFMFMAVTVVAVVIFLCGVMVGRGVRAPRTTEVAATTIESPIDPTESIQPTAPVSQPVDSAVASGATVASAEKQEKLSYPDRLSTPTPPSEALKDPVSSPAPIVEPAVAKAVPELPAVRPTKATGSASKTPERKAPKTEPVPVSGGGFVVQVAAVKARGEADTIAKRLQSKGFPSFVTAPSPGAARVYRVRVGKFSDRREAETVARRLEKEEQFKPWITR